MTAPSNYDELVKALGFNGRLASENNDQANARRIEERRQAAAAIMTLEREREARDKLIAYLMSLLPSGSDCMPDNFVVSAVLDMGEIRKARWLLASLDAEKAVE